MSKYNKLIFGFVEQIITYYGANQAMGHITREFFWGDLLYWCLTIAGIASIFSFFFSIATKNKPLFFMVQTVFTDFVDNAPDYLSNICFFRCAWTLFFCHCFFVLQWGRDSISLFVALRRHVHHLFEQSACRKFYIFVFLTFQLYIMYFYAPDQYFPEDKFQSHIPDTFEI